MKSYEELKPEIESLHQRMVAGKGTNVLKHPKVGGVDANNSDFQMPR